ncbi:MAG: hypothetical protein KAT62_03890 [Desulfuromonadales bacterium]|nr:hypothetical protein [Desulfuromonadales bacterium]
MAVKGLDNVLANLRKEIEGIKGRTEAGMHEAGLFIQGEAQEITPQEFGVLINSAFTSTAVIFGEQIVTRIGYTAHYAPYVHEMPADSNWTKPGTGNKFLQKALNNNQHEVLGIIKEAATIQ